MKKHRIIGKRTVTYALLATMMLTISGCGEKKVKSDEPTSNSKNLTNGVEKEDVAGYELDEDFIYATADFSVELFKESVSTDVEEGKNVLISPESVVCALSMTANGAGGENLREMEEVITGGIDISEYNKYMYTYNNKLTQSDDVDFHIANSLWIKDDEEEIKVNNDFLKVCSNYYDAEAFMAPFDDTTVEEINSWVNENTNEMIPTLLDKIPDEVVMYLINALAFEGEWETPYKDTQVKENQIFTNYSGEEQIVTMLHSKEDIYVCDDRATGFIKYYKGGEFAFMALLPKDENELNEYVENMSGETFINLYNNKSYEDVIVRMPEFSYEYEKELSKPLMSMGMNTAFFDGADFSNMATTGTGSLYINRVLHKTFIQVDREGTKAAAVTAIEMSAETAMEEVEPPKEVILDRPFVYAIIDTQTGLPIFLGVLNSIE